MWGKVIAVMFCVALFSGCVSKGTYNQEVQLYDEKTKQADVLAAQNKTYQELNEKLKVEIKADEVQIQQLKDQLKVTMADELLFREGNTEIDKKGKGALDKMVPVLMNLKDKHIVVQGHTDNLAIHGELKHRFPTNWELSTARASNVVRYLQHKGIDPKLLEASGFSEYQPVASNDTPTGRHKNRRIDIMLMALDR